MRDEPKYTNGTHISIERILRRKTIVFFNIAMHLSSLNDISMNTVRTDLFLLLLLLAAHAKKKRSIWYGNEMFILLLLVLLFVPSSSSSCVHEMFISKIAQKMVKNKNKRPMEENNNQILLLWPLFFALVSKEKWYL